MNLLRLPPWIFGIIVVTTFVVLAIGGLFVFQLLARGRLRLVEHLNNQVIFFASMIGMFYSLTAGMIAVGVWTSYRNAENVVSSEATAIGCLYRDVTGYPEPAKTQMQIEIRAYVDFLLNRAWPLQRQGLPTDEATRMLTNLEHLLVQFEPTTSGQQILHSQVMTQYNQVAALRRQRLNAIGGGLPSVMWSVVLIGAFLTITITYLLDINRKLHFILTGFLSMFIGLVVFVIASLDRPLSGPLAIDSHSYQLVLDRLIDLK
ncbi:MAG TPA: hypothetical protein VJU77_14610 [Chthoniobacterales bacterium]|nr:hypothetical protein [Chthoniobacterales bacterium]